MNIHDIKELNLNIYKCAPGIKKNMVLQHYTCFTEKEIISIIYAFNEYVIKNAFNKSIRKNDKCDEK